MTDLLCVGLVVDVVLVVGLVFLSNGGLSQYHKTFLTGTDGSITLRF